MAVAANDKPVPADLMQMVDAAKEYSEERIGPTGIKYATLRSWARRGWIDVWEVGGRTFVSRKQVEDMLRPKPAKRDDTAEG